MKYDFLALGLVLAQASLGYGVDEKTFTLKDNTQLLCQRMKSGHLEKEEALFVKAFSKAYEGISLETLKIKSLPEFLKGAFVDERDDLNNNKPMDFFIAKVGDGLVGLISFEKTGEKTVYIRQLAVDPGLKGRGIGKALVSLCALQYPEVAQLILATRRINTEARGFYTALGFNETKQVPHDLNVERYVGFEKALA